MRIEWRASRPPAPASASSKSVADGAAARRDERCQADRHAGAITAKGAARTDKAQAGPRSIDRPPPTTPPRRWRRRSTNSRRQRRQRRCPPAPDATRCGRRGRAWSVGHHRHVEAEVRPAAGGGAGGRGGDRPPVTTPTGAGTASWRRQSSARWRMSRDGHAAPHAIARGTGRVAVGGQSRSLLRSTSSGASCRRSVPAGVPVAGVAGSPARARTRRRSIGWVAEHRGLRRPPWPLTDQRRPAVSEAMRALFAERRPWGGCRLRCCYYCCCCVVDADCRYCYCCRIVMQDSPAAPPPEP